MNSDPRFISASDARTELGKLIDAAYYGKEHTVMTKGGQPRAVLVPHDWWKAQQNPADSD